MNRFPIFVVGALAGALLSGCASGVLSGGTYEPELADSQTREAIVAGCEAKQGAARLELSRYQATSPIRPEDTVQACLIGGPADKQISYGYPWRGTAEVYEEVVTGTNTTDTLGQLCFSMPPTQAEFLSSESERFDEFQVTLSDGDYFIWVHWNQNGEEQWACRTLSVGEGAPSPETQINEPPVLAIPQDVSVVAGETMQVALKAEDPNQDAITFNFTDGEAPSWASIDSFSGIVTLAPPSTAVSNEPYKIRVNARDSQGLTDYRRFFATVVDGEPTQIPHVNGAYLGFDSNAFTQTDCTHFVAQGGNNAASGTFASPWGTIAHASSAAQPGDTVCIRGGTYNETIDPRNNGTSSSRITFAAYNGEQVTVRGSASNSIAADLHGARYITLLGMVLSTNKFPALYTYYKSVNANNSKGVEIKNCNIVKDTPTYKYAEKGFGVTASNVEDLTVSNTTISGWFLGLSMQRPLRTTIRDSIIANNLHNQIAMNSNGEILGLYIENNLIGGSLTSDAIQTDEYDPQYADSVRVRGLVIRNNILYFNAENALDFKAGGDILVEGNIIVGSSGDNDGTGIKDPDPVENWWQWRGQSAIGHGSNRTAGRVLVRRNVIYDNPTGFSAAEPGWHAFNNTFVSNNRDLYTHDSHWEGPRPGIVGKAASLGQGHFINNIVVNHNSVAVSFNAGSSERLIDNNIYFESSGVPAFGFRSSGADKNNIQVLTFDGWKSALGGGGDKSSMITNPLFVDVPNSPVFDFLQSDVQNPDFAPMMNGDNYANSFPYDFRLRAGSAAVDAGRQLTHATQSGSNSTILLVTEAGFFFDGYGRPNAGDTIVIDGGNAVQILDINYQANQIFLAEPRSWAAGAGVSLPYEGAKPDIGACESGSSVPLCRVGR